MRIDFRVDSDEVCEKCGLKSISCYSRDLGAEKTGQQTCCRPVMLTVFPFPVLVVQIPISTASKWRRWDIIFINIITIHIRIEFNDVSEVPRITSYAAVKILHNGSIEGEIVKVWIVVRINGIIDTLNETEMLAARI